MKNGLWNMIREGKCSFWLRTNFLDDIFIYRCKLIGGRDLGERTENSKIIFIISLDFPLVIFI